MKGVSQTYDALATDAGSGGRSAAVRRGAPWGELLFGALAAAGCETELVVLPGEGHVPASRRYALEAIRRTQAWFDRYLAPAR